jgi:hypothetical protein
VVIGWPTLYRATGYGATGGIGRSTRPCPRRRPSSQRVADRAWRRREGPAFHSVRRVRIRSDGTGARRPTRVCTARASRSFDRSSRTSRARLFTEPHRRRSPTPRRTTSTARRLGSVQAVVVEHCRSAIASENPSGADEEDSCFRPSFRRESPPSRIGTGTLIAQCRGPTTAGCRQTWPSLFIARPDRCQRTLRSPPRKQ